LSPAKYGCSSGISIKNRFLKKTAVKVRCG